MEMVFRPTLIFGSIIALTLLSGCKDETLESNQKELLDQVESLQAQLEEMQSRMDTGVSSRLNDLERRVSESEAASGEQLEGVSGAFQEQTDRMDRMARSLGSLGEIVQAGQTWVTFGLGYEGHAVARTPHGSFLVELTNQERSEDGFRLDLRVGNTANLQVHQFRIYGEFGAPPPEWNKDEEEYQSYVSRMNTWEGTLHEFEQEFVQELMPDDWNQVQLTIPAERLADLAFIRFRMKVERASLRKERGDKWAVVGADYKGATILETRYGSFPLTVSRIRKEEDHYDLILLVGNPLGMTITSSTFSGSFGPEPPTMATSTGPDDYSEKLVIWDRTLQPFEIQVKDELIPYHWNEVTLKLPTLDREKLSYIRVNMDIQNVSLRNRD